MRTLTVKHLRAALDNLDDKVVIKWLDADKNEHDGNFFAEMHNNTGDGRIVFYKQGTANPWEKDGMQ